MVTVKGRTHAGFLEGWEKKTGTEMTGDLKHLLEQYREEDKKIEESEQTRDEARRGTFVAVLDKAGVTIENVAEKNMTTKTWEKWVKKRKGDQTPRTDGSTRTGAKTAPIRTSEQV